MDLNYTTVDLVSLIAEFAREITFDMVFKSPPNSENDTVNLDVDEFEDADSAEQKISVFEMGLPEKSIETKEIPYIIVQYLNSESDGERRFMNLRFVIGIYNDAETGRKRIAEIIDRIEFGLYNRRVFGNKFFLATEKSHMMSDIVYPEDTAPYYFAEIRFYISAEVNSHDITDFRESIIY